MEKPAIEGGKPVRKTFLPPFRPLIGKEEIEEVVDTLKSGWWSTGPKVQRFEEMARTYIGSKYAIALSSCTHALHLALAAYGIRKGDEVITTPFTFVSTVNVILHQNATPVLVDIEKDYYSIDPSKIEKAITKRTKAIIPVHYAGQPSAIDEVKRIAKKYRLFLLEDGAHAFGSMYRRKRIGTFGDAAGFSFYAGKNLAMGEGGMLCTNNTAFAKKVRLLSLHGMSRDAWKRYSGEGYWYYEVLYPGYKCNMTDIQASLGIHQLKKFPQFIKRKQEIAKQYDEVFGMLPELTIPKKRPEGTHMYYLYPLLLNIERLKIGRDQFIEALRAENIGTSVHFIPVHLHPYYKKTFGYKRGNFPTAENIYERVISLPVHASMNAQDVNDVVEAVKKIIYYYRKT